jgi:hypothetical protein
MYPCNSNSFVAVAAMAMGDRSEAQAWVDASQTKWVAAGRPWPWTVADAGNRALVAAWLSSGKSAPSADAA